MDRIEGYAAEVYPSRSVYDGAPLLVHNRYLRLLWYALRTIRHRDRPSRARLGRYTIRWYRYALRVRGHPWLLLLLLPLLPLLPLLLLLHALSQLLLLLHGPFVLLLLFHAQLVLLLLFHAQLLLRVDASIGQLYRRALPWDGTVQRPSCLAAPMPRL